MDVRAAVAFEAGQPLSIEKVQLAGLKADEVMVEVKATGVCHTDSFTLSGADPERPFPAILGHEGAGVVVEVGPGVASVWPRAIVSEGTLIIGPPSLPLSWSLGRNRRVKDREPMTPGSLVKRKAL